MQKISPFLWFDAEAEQAAKFYVSLFKRSKITDVTRPRKEIAGKKKGSVMTVAFTLNGQSFVALNGGSQYAHSPAISFAVECGDQKEVDAVWRKLSRRGKPIQCGWITDRFGITWQIVPAGMAKLINGKDPEKARRATEAMLKMVKLDLAELQRAYDGK